MNKPRLLFRGPVKTMSGYGAHSRDLLESLYKSELFHVEIDSCLWGSTPLTALDENNPFHNWIQHHIVSGQLQKPDIYVQVTVPNEFQPLGNLNIGITAGIETTVAPLNWIEGCNKMDLIIVPSTFSRDVLLSTVYNETDNITGRLTKQHRIERPVSVLFEGVDTHVYNNKYTGIDLDIKEDFAFLFVGHWLRGNVGQDRKDVGMLIKCFLNAFSGEQDKPALILKTSSATFSVKQREELRKKIEHIVGSTENPPPIYLLFGELSNAEMNELYNHPKIKSMVSLTKGEGFGRPLLEFSMTGKPIITSNWSGHKDFLPTDKSILVGGTLTEVDDSVIDDFIIKGSQWFTANYDEFTQVLKVVRSDYSSFITSSEELRETNRSSFSLEKMGEEFIRLLKPFMSKPKEQKLKLPEFKKIS